MSSAVRAPATGGHEKRLGNHAEPRARVSCHVASYAASRMAARTTVIEDGGRTRPGRGDSRFLLATDTCVSRRSAARTRDLRCFHDVGVDPSRSPVLRRTARRGSRLRQGRPRRLGPRRLGGPARPHDSGRRRAARTCDAGRRPTAHAHRVRTRLQRPRQPVRRSDGGVRRTGAVPPAVGVRRPAFPRGLHAVALRPDAPPPAELHHGERARGSKARAPGGAGSRRR